MHLSARVRVGQGVADVGLLGREPYPGAEDYGGTTDDLTPAPGHMAGPRAGLVD